MGVSEKHLAIVQAIKQSDLNSYKALSDLLDMAKVIADEEGDNDLGYALKLTDFIKRKVPTLPVSVGLNELYWEALKFEALHRFESYLLYMEKNRSPKKRFYQPRAKTLKIVVDDLQDLEDGVIEFYGLSLQEYNESLEKWNEEVKLASTNRFKISGIEYDENGVNKTLSGFKDKIVSWWNDDVVAWWDDNVEPWFTKEKWQEFGENAKSGLSDKWMEFTDWWKTTGLYKWWNEEVAPYFSKDTWSWDGIQEGLTEAWNGAIEALKGRWNKFAEWMNDKLTFNIDTSSIIGKGISEILGTSKISFGSLPTFSAGGFPEDGLFMANRGELVGQFANGRTAVANNEQITAGFAEAVYPAVYNAVYAAINNNSGLARSPEIRVFVGDREITDIAIDGINERARTTGQTPILLW